jgi:hypothetical protein
MRISKEDWQKIRKALFERMTPEARAMYEKAKEDLELSRRESSTFPIRIR